MNGCLQFGRKPLFAKAVLAFLFVAIAALLVIPAAALAASSDVHTVYDDGMVYYGGFYDIEFTTDFTPASYQWRASLDCGHAGVKRSDLSDSDDPNYWSHGTKTNHLRFGTVCDEWLKNGSDDNDFGLLRFYCEITDTAGKKHYTDDYMIRVRSLGDFKARLESSGGFNLVNVTPSPYGIGLTGLYMNKGESKHFEFTPPSLPGWVEASEPTLVNCWEVLEGTTGKHVRYEGTSFDFVPEADGSYIVAGGSTLKLGNADTGISSWEYYRVEVGGPGPSKTLINKIDRVNLTFGAYVNPSACSNVSIPSGTVAKGPGYSNQANLSGAWQVNKGSGWQPLGSSDTRFVFPNTYRYVVTITPKSGYAFDPDGTTLYLNCTNVYGPSTVARVFATAVESVAESIKFVVAEYEPANTTPDKTDDIIDDITDHGEPKETPKNGWETDGYGNTYYYVDDVAFTGWHMIDGKWYCFESSGVLVKSDWRKWGGKWYYLGADGAMYINRWVPDGADWYYVGSDGAMYANRWLGWGGDWYYFGGDGRMLTNRWLEWGGDWYYFWGDGTMAHDAWIGTWHVGPDGRWDN